VEVDFWNTASCLWSPPRSGDGQQSVERGSLMVGGPFSADHLASRSPGGCAAMSVAGPVALCRPLSPPTPELGGFAPVSHLLRREV
jgi:hypothetical protein